MVVNKHISPSVCFSLITINLLALFPHLNLLPLWLACFCCLCVVWRLFLLKKKIPLPRTFTKLVLIIFVSSGVLIQYIGKSGPEVGVSLLTVAFALKMLELQWVRDGYVITILSIFIACMWFLFSMTLFTGLYAVFIFTLAIALFVQMNRSHDHQKSFVSNIKYACIMLLQSIPMMVILFVFFPRVDPIWANNTQKIDETGLKETMSPSDLADMAGKNQLAFRVEFLKGHIPTEDQLYWRALILSEFDGLEWSVKSSEDFYHTVKMNRPLWLRETQFLGKPIPYRVILPATGQRFAVSLELSKPGTEEFLYTRDLRFLFPDKIVQTKEYEMVAYQKFILENKLSKLRYDQETKLPIEGNERSKSYAKKMFGEARQHPRVYIQSILNSFKQEPFFYTLKAPKLEKDIIDAFLFESRKGFCAHYASALVFLARSVGIPARVVVGYQGGEINPFGQYLVVKQLDAHAWSEIWFEEAGWVRYDPTTYIAESRILDTPEQMAGEATVSDDAILVGGSFQQWAGFRAIRQWGDYMELKWNKVVVSFDKERQEALLSQFWGKLTRQLFLMLSAVALFLMGALFIWFWLTSKKSQLNELEKAYLEYCALLEENGFERKQGETPEEFCRRISVLKPDWAQTLRMITDIFYQEYYASLEPSASLRGSRKKCKKAAHAIVRLAKSLM